MENREEQILSEIRSVVSSIRMQFEELDSKISELHRIYGCGSSFDAPIDLDLDDELPAEDEASPSDYSAVVPVPDVFADSPENEAEQMSSGFPDVPSSPEPKIEPVVPETVTEHASEPIYEKAQNEMDMPKAVIDMMAEKQAWRIAIPGTPVRDIRSAISLNDRIIFINLLFGEDPVAFQQALTQINSMETLGQAVEYIAAEHPDWDLDSDLVYRFMMAVRRKVK
ncbi:MAG: hypothetical protein K2G18_02805 [Bacteroidales bacterium]|nr:hypothetical protein [Bacteroidales bacterium]